MGATIDVTTIRHATSFEARFKTFQVALDSSYPTGGYAIDPKDLGLAEILFFMAAPKSGYVFSFDHDNKKLMAYRYGGVSAGTSGGTSGGTPAGSVAAPAFTGAALGTHVHDVLVKGGASGGIDEPLGVEGTDTLAKDAATDRTIVGADSATKGGVVAITGGTPAGTNSAPAFTGSALATHTHTVAAVTAAALTEVTNGVDLAAVTGVRCIAVGY